jgi:localization factor PodJL
MPASSETANTTGNRLEEVTARLNQLAQQLAPKVPEPAVEAPVAPPAQANPDLDRMVADLARRTQESEDRIASALELLTNVLIQAQPAAAPAPHHVEVQARVEARDFPPPPPPAPSRDDRVSRFEERLARLSGRPLPKEPVTEEDVLLLSEPEPKEDATEAVPAPTEVPASAGFTFVPYAVKTEDSVEPSEFQAAPAAPEAAPKPKIKDFVSEINARQRELAADASKDNTTRVRALEDRLEVIAAKMENVSHAPAARQHYASREMLDLNSAVESLARRVTVPLAADGSPEMLSLIHRALGDLSHRFDGQNDDFSAGTLEQLRGSIESLTARLDNARPGEETRAVLSTIQTSIEQLAVRLDQAVQAPSTTEALSAMHAAIEGIGEQVNRIGSLAGKSEKLASLENTIEDLILELRSSGRESAAVSQPEVQTLQHSITTLTHRLDETPPIQVATRDALSNVERAISELSLKIDTKGAPAADAGALTTIQGAIENLADRLERSGTGEDAHEANIAIRTALEAMSSRLDLSDQRLQKLASLEETVTRLAHLVEGRHETTAQAAQDAAARAVREALTDLPEIMGSDNQRMNALSETLHALRNQSEKAERRTVDAFESVRATLERIVVRLATDEAASAKAGPTAEPMDPMSAARAAAMRAIAETEANYAPAVADAGEARSKRARFIAAARRATTPSMPEAVNDDDLEEDLVAQGRGSWNGRRVATIGLAGLLLVLGSFQFGKLALQNQDVQTAQTIEGEKVETQAPAAETAALRDSATATTPAVPAAQVEAAATPALEPVVTGSIPPQVDVPANIGGQTLIESAKRSDPAAFHEIAVRYFDGERVAQDQAKAIIWFEKAAELGFAPAQYRLGNAYDKGHGVTANAGLAESWYRKAADQGHIKAMHNLAVLLAEGSLGKPDYSQAGYWFRRAADRGVRDSQYNLGVMLARGLGVNQDMAEAYKWFAIAATAGDSDSGTKRDQVAAKLKPATLVAARLEAQTWQPLPQDSLANDENAPSGGWDGPAKTS